MVINVVPRFVYWFMVDWFTTDHYSLCPVENREKFSKLRIKGYTNSILTFDTSLESSEQHASTMNSFPSIKLSDQCLIFNGTLICANLPARM